MRNLQVNKRIDISFIEMRGREREREKRSATPPNKNRNGANFKIEWLISETIYKLQKNEIEIKNFIRYIDDWSDCCGGRPFKRPY